MGKFINPEQAAHNIATIFSKEYLKIIENEETYSVYKNDINFAAKEVAKIYEVVFDEVHSQISESNKEVD